MKKHKFRTILIWAAIIIGIIQVFPTIGWMCLSDAARLERLATWQEEDSIVEKPSYWRDNAKSIRRWAQFDRERVINLGLDLQGGVHMVVSISPDDLTDDQRKQYEDDGYSEDDIRAILQRTVLQNILRRVTDLETKEPIIQALGKEQIQIQLPGVKDTQRVIDLIMKPAVLKFHLVAGLDDTKKAFVAIDNRFNGNFLPRLKESLYGGSLEVPVSNFEMISRFVKEATEEGGLIPEGYVIAFGSKPEKYEEEQVMGIYLMEEDAQMGGEGLHSALPRQSLDNPANFEITFEFERDASSKFGEITEANIGRRLAIVLDGVVESAPNIQTAIHGGGRITGGFSSYEAQDLAIALNSGSLPVKPKEEYTGIVGASLGEDSIRKGTRSSIVGLTLVVIFMLIYYRIGGVIANIALVLNALLIVALLAYTSATLTLPGIAGLILTIGMAVDANVLIFERIREELKNGHSLATSVESGYAHATWTILDANVTTLIAAAVLFQFGTGPIQGFAQTLSIGVVCSVFTALVITRSILDFITEGRKLETIAMMSILKKEPTFKFIDNRKMALIASAVAIAIGLGVFGSRLAVKGDMLGVDFKEGTSMIVSLESPEPVAIEDVREGLAGVGFDDIIVTKFDGGNAGDTASRFTVRIGSVSEEPDVTEDTQETSEADSAVDEEETADKDKKRDLVATQVEGALALLADKVVLEKVETVGPAVGDQLRKDAGAAIFYAVIFIIIYLWMRFELKFALGAVAALLHDVLITIGLFAITGRQITMPVVAALLTIIGYSLNDTIVVFDRIRENLRLYRGRNYTYPQVMNMSINQTLSRTLLTSITTLVVIVVLLIFGGQVINDFAFALLVGVIVGTYSSIFVASPVVLFLQSIQRKQGLPMVESKSAKKKKTKKANTAVTER